MEEDKLIAEVTQVTLHPAVETSEGVKVGGFTVHAKLFTQSDKYSMGLYYVKILEPAALGYLQPEQGLLMEDGRFSFDATEEVNVKEKLEISVSSGQ